MFTEDFVKIAETLDKSLEPIGELQRLLDATDLSKCKKFVGSIKSLVEEALGIAEENCDLGFEEE